MSMIEAKVKFTLNAGFIPEIEQETKPEIGRQAWHVWREAKGMAPRRTGYYVGHVRLNQSANPPVVYTDDPFGHLVEWGSVNNPAYAPLRRAVASVGLRFTADAK